MLRNIFDIHDGKHITFDDIGIELASVEVAKNEATRVLPDIVKDELLVRDRRSLVVIVKDEVEHEFWRVTLSLAVASLSQGSAATT